MRNEEVLMNSYKKIIYPDGKYKILKVYDDGYERFVDENYREYVNWLLEDNKPEEIKYIPKLLTEEEKWKLIRKKRNQLLFDSDWTQLSDTQFIVDVLLYRQYRQQLRDIPQVTKNADNVIFPTEPSK